MKTKRTGFPNVPALVLEGRSVRLEPLSLAHLDGIVEAGADDEIWTWMPVHPGNRDGFKNWIDRALKEQAAGNRLPFAIVDRSSAAILGSTSLLAPSHRDRRIEIGWTWLTPLAQRTAVNTECKYLLLRHCFETLGCLRVEFKADARNARSRGALLRIGAHEEGTFRKHQLAQDGVQRDSVYFSIIVDDWPEVKARLSAMLERQVFSPGERSM